MERQHYLTKSLRVICLTLGVLALATISCSKSSDIQTLQVEVKLDVTVLNATTQQPVANENVYLINYKYDALKHETAARNQIMLVSGSDGHVHQTFTYSILPSEVIYILAMLNNFDQLSPNTQFIGYVDAQASAGTNSSVTMTKTVTLYK